MQADTITARIRKFIFATFPLARKQDIKSDDGLLESGVIDSLGVLEIVTFLEHEFQIILTDDELLPENFQSIASLTAFVNSKINSSSSVQVG
jgi:acyl carrier protein